MNYSSNSDYEILPALNLEHESDSEFYKNPYIDSDGEIYYGDTRPADWDIGEPINGMEKAENNGNDIAPENNPETDKDRDTGILDIFIKGKDN